MSIFTVLILFAICFMTTSSTHNYKLKSFVDHIPGQDRIEFLTYALKQGYDKIYNKPTQSGQRSPELFKELYLYFMKYHRVHDGDILPRDVVCFPSGCVDLSDPSIHPFGDY